MSHPVSPLPALLVEPIVRAALVEDLGRAGDITSDAVIPAEVRFAGAIVSREHGVVAGVDCAAMAFRLIDPAGAAMDESTAPAFADWKNRGADALSAGSIVRSSDGRQIQRAIHGYFEIITLIR